MARRVQDSGYHYFQNFFRLYDKLSGMTGTAMTEEDEFSSIYDLDIVEIPTNKPVVRTDYPDVVYKTEVNRKYRAIVKQIEECHEKGQPSWWVPFPSKSRAHLPDAPGLGASPTTC